MPLKLVLIIRQMNEFFYLFKSNATCCPISVKLSMIYGEGQFKGINIDTFSEDLTMLGRSISCYNPFLARRL